MGKKVRKHLHHCAKSISCVTGVVLIWHGIGLALEHLQGLFFVGHEVILAAASFLLGIAILYLPDRNLDELQ